MVPGSSQSSPPQPVTVGVRTGGGTDSSGVFHKCQPSGLPVSRPKAAGTCPRPLPARWVEPQGPSLPAWPLITPPFPLSPSPAIVFTGAVNWAPTVCQVIASFREPPSSHYLLGKGERKKKNSSKKSHQLMSQHSRRSYVCFLRARACPSSDGPSPGGCALRFPVTAGGLTFKAEDVSELGLDK